MGMLSVVGSIFLRSCGNLYHHNTEIKKSRDALSQKGSNNLLTLHFTHHHFKKQTWVNTYSSKLRRNRNQTVLDSTVLVIQGKSPCTYNEKNSRHYTEHLTLSERGRQLRLHDTEKPEQLKSSSYFFRENSQKSLPSRHRSLTAASPKHTAFESCSHVQLQ
jgi:transposase